MGDLFMKLFYPTTSTPGGVGYYQEFKVGAKLVGVQHENVRPTEVHLNSRDLEKLLEQSPEVLHRYLEHICKALKKSHTYFPYG